MRDRIEIDKEELPYEMEIVLGEEVYTMEIFYNEAADLFTVNLKSGEIYLCIGEPVIYGVPLFSDVFMPDTFPVVEIVPFDESGSSDAVTYENFNVTVFLTIDDGEEETD